MEVGRRDSRFTAPLGARLVCPPGHPLPRDPGILAPSPLRPETAPRPCRPHMTWPSLRVFQSLTGAEANAPGNCLNTAPATGKAGSQLPAVTQLLPRPPRGTTRPLRGQRATLKGTRGPADDDGPWHSGEPLSASYSPPASTLETPAEEPAPGCPAMLCGLRQVA